MAVQKLLLLRRGSGGPNALLIRHGAGRNRAANTASRARVAATAAGGDEKAREQQGKEFRKSSVHGRQRASRAAAKRLARGRNWPSGVAAWHVCCKVTCCGALRSGHRSCMTLRRPDDPRQRTHRVGEAATTTVNRLGIRPGLRRGDFKRVAQGGFGDGLNAYAHSMAWFNGHLYVGTTRGNFPLMKARLPIGMDVWPVECPGGSRSISTCAPRSGATPRATIAGSGCSRRRRSSAATASRSRASSACRGMQVYRRPRRSAAGLVRHAPGRRRAAPGRWCCARKTAGTSSRPASRV